MKKVFSLVLFVILTIAVSVTAFAADSDIIASGYCGAEGDGTNLEWVLTEDGTLTISGEGKMECYKSTNNGKQITSAPWGEYSDHLKTLVMEEGVTNIGCCAFAFCSGFEGTLVIPNSVTIIEDSAFVLCSGFTGNLVIPNNVTEIGWYAFDKCDGFNGKLIIGKGITNIGDRAFYGCSKLTGNLFIHNDEISIGSLAFCNCGINNYYFGGDAPEMVRIPGESIIYDHFDKTDDTIYYPSGNSTWEVVDGKWNGYNVKEIIASGYCGGEGDGTNLEWVLTEDGALTISGTGKMADYGDFGQTYMEDAPWKQYKDQIKSLVIEEGVTSIGGCAFYKSSFIKGKLVLPETVTRIGVGAFAYCDGLSGELVIPESVMYIDSHAFFYCRGLNGNLEIGEKVSSLDSSSFSGTGIENISVPDNNTKYCSVDGILYSKDLKTLILCPGGKTGSIVIPKSVERIEWDSFRDCKNLTGSITLPDSIVTIGRMAFESCSIDEYYFRGDAPSGIIVNGTGMPNFDYDDTIYYPEGNATWVIENGKWKGYNAVAWKVPFEIGDINQDRKVDVKDVYLARLAAAKLVVPAEEEFSLGDVDGNGRINAIDANLIRKFCANIITKFPVEG